VIAKQIKHLVVGLANSVTARKSLKGYYIVTSTRLVCGLQLRVQFLHCIWLGEAIQEPVNHSVAWTKSVIVAT
jgi:hypothetical protein